MSDWWREDREVPGKPNSKNRKWKLGGALGKGIVPHQRDPGVCYFIKERTLLKYAKYGRNSLEKYVRQGKEWATMYWGRRKVLDFLKALYSDWERGHALGYRTSAKEVHGFTPTIFLGDVGVWGGGSNGRHRTHAHGLEVDIYYIPQNGQNKSCVCDEDWHPDLNKRLLHGIFRAGSKSGAKYVKTSSSDFMKLYRDGEWDESRGKMYLDLDRPAKISDARHADHFHVQF